MHAFFSLGAKIEDVLPPVVPPSLSSTTASDATASKREQHWSDIARHYQLYDAFLVKLYEQVIESRRVALSDEEAMDDADFRAAVTHIRETPVVVIDDYDDDDQIVKVWQRRIEIYDMMRTIVQRAVPRFDAYEDIFVYSLAIGKFYQKLGPVVAFFRETVLDVKLVPMRNALVEQLYDKAMAPDKEVSGMFTELAQIDLEIDVRIKLYEKEEEVRVIYATVLRNAATDLLFESQRGPLFEIMARMDEIFFLLAATGMPLLEKRLKVRNLLMSAQSLVAQLEVVPRVLYRDGRLEVADSGQPITTLDPLRMPRLEKTRLAVRPVAHRAFLSNELITASSRLIELIPGNVQFEQLVDADLQRLLVANMAATSSPHNTMFDRYRQVPYGQANCRVYRVSLDDRHQIAVLVATRPLQREEPLLRDYTDSELYQIWLRYTENATSLANISSTVNERKARQRIGELELARMRISASTPVGGESDIKAVLKDTDFRLRIHVLSQLLVVK